MFDVLSTMGAAAIGEIIKQSVAGAINWAKGRKKPAPAVIEQKVEQIVSGATNKVVPDALTPEDRQRIVSGLIDVVRPTLDQVMEYSPNTQRIVNVARKVAAKSAPAKRVAPKKMAAKKAMKKSAKKAPAKRK